MLYIVARVKGGYRLLDTDTKECRNVSERNIIDVLKSGRVKIENAEVVNGGLLKGTNGSLGRFKDYDGITIKQMVIINEIVSKTNDIVGYTIAYSNGVINKGTKDAAIEIAKILGIQNGKLVEKDGKEFISAINGEYAKEKINTHRNIEPKQLAEKIMQEILKNKDLEHVNWITKKGYNTKEQLGNEGWGIVLKSDYKSTTHFKWNNDHDYCERHYDCYSIILDKKFDAIVENAEKLEEKYSSDYSDYKIYAGMHGTKDTIAISVRVEYK